MDEDKTEEIEIDPVEEEAVEKIDESLDLSFTSSKRELGLIASGAINQDKIAIAHIEQAVNDLEEEAMSFQSTVLSSIDRIDDTLAVTTEKLDKAASVLSRVVDALGRGFAVREAAQEKSPVAKKLAYNEHFFRVFLPGIDEPDLANIEWEYDASISAIEIEDDGITFDVDMSPSEAKALLSDYGGQKISSATSSFDKTTPPASKYVLENTPPANGWASEEGETQYLNDLGIGDSFNDLAAAISALDELAAVLDARFTPPKRQSSVEASFDTSNIPGSLVSSWDESGQDAQQKFPDGIGEYVKWLADFVDLVDSGRGSEYEKEEFDIYWGSDANSEELAELAYLRGINKARW